MKYFILPIIIISSIVFFFSCTQSINDPAETINVEGYLTDGNDNIIENAVLTASENEELISTDTTNSEGYFVLSGLPESNHDNIMLSINHSEFDELIVSLTEFINNLDSNKSYKLKDKFLEQDCCNEIQIKVSDESGEEIEEAEVKLNQGKDIISKKYTNSDGYVKFEEVCDGDYWIRIYKEGYKVIEKEINVSECDSLYYEFELLQKEKEDCCNEVKFKVFDKNENEVDKAKVQIFQDGQLVEQLKTNSDGWVIFDGLCDGEYEYYISKEGVGEYEGVFGVDNCDSLYKEIFLENEECCNSLKIMVRDEDENAVKNALVKIYKNDKLIKQIKSDEDGDVRFENLCDGEYKFLIFKEGFQDYENSITLNNCDTLTLEIFLENEECCNSIELIIKDKDGNHINEAEIKLYHNEEKIGLKYSNQDGYVKFENLCDGKYWFRVYKDGFEVKEENFEVDNCENKEIVVILQNKDDSDCCNFIRLKVYDEEENPLKRAEIRLNKKQELIEKLYTNENGVVEFDGVCEGNYWFRVFLEYYKVIEKEISVSDCDTITKSIILTKKIDCCKGEIKLIPKDKESGEIIKNAYAKLWKDGKLIKTAEVSDGRIHFKELCEGKYGIDIISSDYENIEFLVELGCNEKKEIIKKLNRTQDDCCEGMLKIYLFDKDTEEKIYSGKIRLWKNDELLEQANVNESGYAIIDNICKGNYWVDIISDEYKDMEFQLEFGCDEKKVLEKFLEKK